MTLARPEFAPDPNLSREATEALQEDIATEATFDDQLPSDVDLARSEEIGDIPLIAGVDQAFLDDRAISGIVLLRGPEVVERVHAITDVEIPYIPGLLSFREGGSILAAFERLSRRPDVVLFDGSGRIHFREAGLATHLGVALDLPSVGVAKQLLCGRPRESLDDLSEGARVAIEADDRMTAPTGTLVGYAVQTRQFDSPNRYVNPLYVSPGHRVSASTAADVVLQSARGYKLPEPTRRADAYAAEIKADLTA